MPDSDRSSTIVCFLIVAAVFAGGVALGDETTPPPAAAKAAPEAPRVDGGLVNGRWREGSKLNDQIGSFKLTGDRVTFVGADGKLKLLCLENLCIERVSRMISDSPDQLEWMVSGVITEYRGANYLLATQAVMRTKSDRMRRSP